MSKNFHPAPVGSGDANMVIQWFEEALRQVRLTWRLLFDDRVPGWLKLIPPITLAYVLSPIDLVPDVMPGLGQLDDLAVLLIGIKAFIELAPRDVVREHLIALGAQIQKWRVVDDEGDDSLETVVGELDPTVADSDTGT